MEYGFKFLIQSSVYPVWFSELQEKFMGFVNMMACQMPQHLKTVAEILNFVDIKGIRNKCDAP